MTGLINRHTNLALQLKASSIFAEVNGFAARVLATLTYFNNCEYDVEGAFVFPQDERTTVVEFEATVEERHVFMEVKEFVSIQAENSVYAIEEREDELFSNSIGSIPPLCSVFIQVTLITELGTDQESGGSLFVLPSVFTPRLASPEDIEDEIGDVYGSQMLIADLPRRTFEPYSFELELEVAAPCLLAGCSSPTHAIQVGADSAAMNASRIHISIAEPHTYDREIEIVLHLSHPYDPYVLIEEGKKEAKTADRKKIASAGTEEANADDIVRKPALMINYTPRLSPKGSESEFIFLVDRSGSMSGEHIYHVKETLILSLKSLPENCLFNMIGFGSYYRSLFPESQRFCEETAAKACAYVQKMRADLGGTNLLPPLRFIFEKATVPGTPRVVFLMTDGSVANTTEVVDFVRQNVHSTRFYAFGLGPEACPNLVQGVAGVTRGQAYFISEEERMPVKVMDALQHAMQPAITDIEVSWHLPEGYDVIQTPKRVPVVFDKERLVLYGILSRPAGSEDKGSPRTPVKRKIDWSMRSFSNSSVKVFWFEDEFEFLPEEQLLMEADETEEVSENEFKRDGRYVFPRTRLEALSDQEDDNLHHDACAGVSADHLGDDGSRAQDSMVEAETKDRVTSGCLKFQQRDSGVEFGMEESDKSPDGRDEEENEFEPKEAEMPRETPLTDSTGAALESAHEPFVRVYKDSGYLEQIGVPADFGAVRIKGYSGSDEVEQVIPFPVNRSGGSSKRPTIHQLVARSLIRELQPSRDPTKVAQVRIVSKVSKVHCRHTALVTLDQYCYEDEFLSALKFPPIEEPAKTGSQNGLNIETKLGFTSGLGRRLPSPEGSDQESLPDTVEGSDNRSLELGEEPVDFYRLERTGTPESWGEDSPFKSATYSPQAFQSPKRPRSLSMRCVGERQLIKSKMNSCDRRKGSDFYVHDLPEYFGFVRLACLQSAQGSWTVNSSFAGIFDQSLSSLLEASPLADGNVYVSGELGELLASDACDDGHQLWGTALALAWLQRAWPEYHVEWALLAGKAEVWLADHPFPRGFVCQDLKTAAYQALLLLDKNKRDSAELLNHVTKPITA